MLFRVPIAALQLIIDNMLKARIGLLVPGATAKPNPKMGQALGPLGINMAQFCKVSSGH